MTISHNHYNSQCNLVDLCPKFFSIVHVPSFDLPRACVVAYVSSIPRWHFARCLNSARGSDPSLPRGGIVHGMKRFSEDSDKILSGQHLVVNAIMSGCVEVDTARVNVWAALLRLFIQRHTSGYDLTSYISMFCMGNEFFFRMEDRSFTYY